MRWLPVLLLLAACGTPADTLGADDGLLQGAGTVLESPDRGPRLCAAVMESYPPQCDGVPLTGWDWDAVEGEESAGGTTWGEYAVRGTWDGRSLTVAGVDVPGPPPPLPDPAAPDGEARTPQELREVQEQLPAVAAELGLVLTDSGTYGDAVQMGVWVATPEQEAELDERFDGAVRVRPLLAPVSSG